MSGLSLAMIVRDEQETLERVLSDAAPVCDQLVVVDTGSTDDTIEIARRLGAEVFQLDCSNDFSAARNYSFSKCHGDWILWLDADDRVPPRARQAIRRIYNELRDNVDVEAVALPYLYSFVPPDSDNCVLRQYRERMLRNGRGLAWKGAVHEIILHADDESRPLRTLSHDDAWVEHRPTESQLQRKTDRNMTILQRMVDEGDRSVNALTQLALEFVGHDRLNEAAGLFEEVLARPSDSAGVSSLVVTGDYYRTICSYSQCEARGDEHKQRQLLLRAIDFDSKRAEAFVMLGELCMEQTRHSEAVPLLHAAGSLKRPENVHYVLFDPAYSYLPWDHLATCAMQLGELQSALHYCERALIGNPERERILDNVWLILDRLEQSPAPNRP